MASNDPRDYVLGQELTIRILTTGEQTSGRHDLVDAFQLPDTATPLHLHTRYEERLFVLEGESTLWVGPDMVQLRPGDYCAIPLNTPHAIKAGPNGCRSLLITSPAGFAELIARAATPARLAGPDTEIVVRTRPRVDAGLNPANEVRGRCKPLKILELELRDTLRRRQLRESVPPRPPSKRLTTPLDHTGHSHSLVQSALCSPPPSTPTAQTRASTRNLSPDVATFARTRQLLSRPS